MQKEPFMRKRGFHDQYAFHLALLVKSVWQFIDKEYNGLSLQAHFHSASLVLKIFLYVGSYLGVNMFAFVFEQ